MYKLLELNQANFFFEFRRENWIRNSYIALAMIVFLRFFKFSSLSLQFGVDVYVHTAYTGGRVRKWPSRERARRRRSRRTGNGPGAQATEASRTAAAAVVEATAAFLPVPETTTDLPNGAGNGLR